MKGFLIGLIIAAIGGIGVTAVALDNDDTVKNEKGNYSIEESVNRNEFCDDDCKDGYHNDDCKKDDSKYIEMRKKVESEIIAQFGENWKEDLKSKYGSEWDDVVEDKLEDKLEKVYGDDVDDILDDILDDDDCDDKDDQCNDLNDDNTCDDDCNNGYHDDDCNLDLSK